MQGILSLIFDIVRALFLLLIPRGKSKLLAEFILVRQQLKVISRKRLKAPRLNTLDRIVFAFSSLFISSTRLPKLSYIVAHSTLLKFHRALVKKKYSFLFSNKKSNKPGPKGPSKELISLVVEIKEENNRFGTEQIAQLVSKLLETSIDECMVRRILKNHYHQGPGGGPSWLCKIGCSKDKLWCLDFFRCESLGLQSYWAMLVMDLFSRKIIDYAVHKGPIDGSAAVMMLNQIIFRYGASPKYLSTDHDPVFRFHRWASTLRIFEIEEIKTVPHVPWSHPHPERLIGTTRRDLLDRTFFWNQSSLEKKLLNFQNYYNGYRTHRSLKGDTPSEQLIKPIDISNYRWQPHCDGLFQIPIPA